MVRGKCIRCEKYCLKGGCGVGGTEYLRTFLKAEKGVTEDELAGAFICNACRAFIYNLVFHPEKGKSRGCK